MKKSKTRNITNHNLNSKSLISTSTPLFSFLLFKVFGNFRMSFMIHFFFFILLTVGIAGSYTYTNIYLLRLLFAFSCLWFLSIVCLVKTKIKYFIFYNFIFLIFFLIRKEFLKRMCITFSSLLCHHDSFLILLLRLSFSVLFKNVF